ncbi:hypothetical protein OBBRIDRAFT_445996 [Obba rivulosa]|uniref:Btz domain-containing protein n=1 Tax=Obba rivulosa TaxID=1052685 RepID=A0A8E2DUK0_9APHY|nr:hypothetical protein OBBRIDRAFT_445996 [Obba rivulosa]
MPAPITIATTKSEKPTEMTFSRPQSKKTRVVRRRGRARNGVDSDEEFVREVGSDTDTDDDDASSLDSESETDTTQSPPPLDIHERSDLDGIAVKPVAMTGETGPFVAPSNWAEMVANETANGAEDLPVIDFADLDRHPISQTTASPPPPPTRKPKKQPTHRPTPAPAATPAVPATPLDDQEHIAQDESAKASTSAHPPREPSFSRPKGQTARQAYQQRLETDPSFVPKVGEFWGHDDRLLDKDLRSLSGWWRGRWQSRGRARGTFVMRGRGGRGFAPGRPGPHGQDSEGGENSIAPVDVPPIEKPWGHDGFEEMKRREEQRRAQQEQERQQQRTPPHATFQRGFGFRGRGAFVPRGRGFGRGGASSPPGSRPGPPFAPVNRPWYAMKPERVWTKQHEAFLYFDLALKPRPGMGQGYRVKLPGKEEEVIRSPPRSYPPSTSQVRPSVNVDQDDGEKVFTVRIPRRAETEHAEVPLAPVAMKESATTVEEISLEEIFTVRPHIVPNRRVDLSLSASAPSATQDITNISTQPVASTSSGLVSQAQSPASTSALPPVMEPQQRLTELSVLPTSDAPPSIRVQETVLKHPPSPVEHLMSPVAPAANEQRPVPPVLHPLQTTFSPVPQVTPPYGSPYAYGPALPPGIGLNQHGMPYELATGRPVYIQPTPPPPMFTPRPMMHGHMPHHSVSAPFVPTHMHHHSHSTASPDFLAQPHAHTPPSFIDPMSGVPIFTPARQSSRIEIRAPTDTEGKKPHARPSGLRASFSDSGPQVTSAQHPQAPPFVRSSSELPTTTRHTGAPADGQIMEATEQPQQMQAEQAMGYAQYQPPYYYPDQYGYPQYMDMPSQVVQYDVYNPDHRTPQPILYY